MRASHSVRLREKTTGTSEPTATSRRRFRRVSVRIWPQKAQTNGSSRAKLAPQLLEKSNGACGRATS